MVTDFGEAYHVDFPREEENAIPFAYAAPEVLLGGEEVKLGFATDVWALGATICEVRQGRTPFFNADEDDYVRRLEDIIGVLPEPYRSAACKDPRIDTSSCLPDNNSPATMSLEKLDQLKEIRFEKFGYKDALEQIVRDSKEFAVQMQDGEDLTDKPNQRAAGNGYKWIMYQTPQEEADKVLDLLRRIFKYSQTERLTIHEVMAHPWFAGYFDTAAITEEPETTEGTCVEGYDSVEETDVEDSAVEDIAMKDSPVDETHMNDTVVEDSGITYPSPTLTARKEDEHPDSMDLDIDELEKLHHDAEIEEDVAEEDDFDREFKKDPFGALYQECKVLWYQKHPLEQKPIASKKPNPEQARNIPTPASDYMYVDSDEDQEPGYQTPPNEDADTTSALHFFQLVRDVGNVLFIVSIWIQFVFCLIIKQLLGPSLLGI